MEMQRSAQSRRPESGRQKVRSSAIETGNIEASSATGLEQFVASCHRRCMTRPDMTLAVVGGIHANADGSNRLFEIALCMPGEPVQLVPEPKNKHDPSAVAVFSARGVQIGYVSAERCGWIGARIRLGEDVRALFQAAVKGGALVRVGFSGRDPLIPAPVLREAETRSSDWDEDFYPDEVWPDD